jgi:uncharacterized damage-inducible protein DinB
LSAPLSTFYKGWGAYNDAVQRTIAGLDSGQLSLQAAPHLWSVRKLASHIVAVRAWWFYSWMDEGGAELAGFIDFDDGAESEVRGGPDIADALRTSWSSLSACLDRWTEDDLSKEFQRPALNARRGRPWRSRGYIVWHVAEHDLHHGGEISITLGAHGFEGFLD